MASGTLAPSLSNQPTSMGVNLTLESFLNQTLTPDGSIAKTGTPQNKAFVALQKTNPELNPNNPRDQLEITQKYSLNTLYFATDGGNWSVSDSWTTSAAVCSPWFGVTCLGSRVVVGLKLTSNDLMGNLPSEIRGLTSLSKSTTRAKFFC